MTTATSLNELQQQIRDRYDSLSKRLQQVSRYVLDNTNSVAFDTVAVIAERAGVPPSTLIRFANAFDRSISCRSSPVRILKRSSSWQPVPNLKCWNAPYNCWQKPTPFTSPVYVVRLASPPISPTP